MRSLEREFFRHFFAALVTKDVTSIRWRDPATSQKFLAAVDAFDRNLMARYTTNPSRESSDYRRLLRALRPDPLTGATLALDRALVELQFSDVSVANPSYEVVRLLAPPASAQELLNEAAEADRRMFEAMADAYVESGDSTRRKVG